MDYTYSGSTSTVNMMKMLGFLLGFRPSMKSGQHHKQSSIMLRMWGVRCVGTHLLPFVARSGCFLRAAHAAIVTFFDVFPSQPSTTSKPQFLVLITGVVSWSWAHAAVAFKQKIAMHARFGYKLYPHTHDSGKNYTHESGTNYTHDSGANYAHDWGIKYTHDSGTNHTHDSGTNYTHDSGTNNFELELDYFLRRVKVPHGRPLFYVYMRRFLSTVTVTPHCGKVLPYHHIKRKTTRERKEGRGGGGGVLP